jgi:cell division septation protein DedD
MTMQAFSCPHCGAPPPPGYTPPTDRRFGYACLYCGQQSVHGQDPPALQAQVPAIIVVQAPGSSFDPDPCQHQQHAAVARAAVSRSVSWVVWVVIVLFVSLGGAGATFWKIAGKSSLLSSLVWDGSEPLRCSGIEDISVSGVEATFNAGAAITAEGNCHVKCTDCKLTAPTAIEAGGNAQVTIINGSVRGTTILADATSNARVTITGKVTVSGATRERGNARVSAPTPLEATTATPTPTHPPVAPTAAAPPAPRPTAKGPAPTKPKTSPK